jgi:hypothetical protein
MSKCLRPACTIALDLLCQRPSLVINTAIRHRGSGVIQPPHDDERTNSMGLFNTAEAFRLSAMALKDEKEIGHAANPMRLCYHHTLELYLKALLLQKHSVETIRKKFSHNTSSW